MLLFVSHIPIQPQQLCVLKQQPTVMILVCWGDNEVICMHVFCQDLKINIKSEVQSGVQNSVELRTWDQARGAAHGRGSTMPPPPSCSTHVEQINKNQYILSSQNCKTCLHPLFSLRGLRGQKKSKSQEKTQLITCSLQPCTQCEVATVGATNWTILQRCKECDVHSFNASNHWIIKKLKTFVLVKPLPENVTNMAVKFFSIVIGIDHSHDCILCNNVIFRYVSRNRI
jgi:hypothetical protein